VKIGNGPEYFSSCRKKVELLGGCCLVSVLVNGVDPDGLRDIAGTAEACSTGYRTVPGRRAFRAAPNEQP
jgi:hypothetical protein